VKLPGRSTGSGDEEAGAGAGNGDDGVGRPYLGLASQTLGAEVAGDDRAQRESLPERTERRSQNAARGVRPSAEGDEEAAIEDIAILGELPYDPKL
jgi:hypothetical protein